MQDREVDEHINKMILEQCSKRIDNDTILVLDITHIPKPYAKKMDFLSLVWEGMEREKVKGYRILFMGRKNRG